jgi:hypothetical protein
MVIFTVMESDEFQAQKSGSEMPPSCRTGKVSKLAMRERPRNGDAHAAQALNA